MAIESSQVFAYVDSSQTSQTHLLREDLEFSEVYTELYAELLKTFCGRCKKLPLFMEYY